MQPPHILPVIRTRADIFDHIVVSEEFDLVEAVTMHLIELDFRKAVDEHIRATQPQAQSKARVTLPESEINQIILHRYNVEMLDRFRDEAFHRLQVYETSVTIKDTLAQVFTADVIAPYLDPLIVKRKGGWGSFGYYWKSAWLGVWGNVLTITAGFFLAVFVAAYKDNDLKQHAVDLGRRIIVYLSDSVPSKPGNLPSSESTSAKDSLSLPNQ